MNDEPADSAENAPTVPPTEEKAAPPAAPAHPPEAAPTAAHEHDHAHAHAAPEPVAGSEASADDAPEAPERAAPETVGATHEAPATEELVPVEKPVSEELVPVTATAAEPPAEAKPEEPTEAPPADDEAAPKKAKKPRAKKTAATATAADGAAPSATATPGAPPSEAAGDNKKKWYAIKVQSGREDSIKAAIMRKVAIEGLEEFFGRIEIPVEEEIVKKAVRVKDKKTGEYTTQEKKVVRKKKKFQGYLFAELEFNDRVLYLIRDTSGVGDFLNLRHKKDAPPTPEPMPDHEVQSMLTGVVHRDPLKKKVPKIDFEKGDKVRIKEGSFAGFEGVVKEVIEAKDPNEAPKISVALTFWGRETVTEFDSAHVEKV